MKLSQELLNELVEAAEAVYQHTRDECGQCKAPHSCCSPEYCEMAEEYSREDLGIDVSAQRTSHRKLPFMGETGCVLAPHLRPLCTMHTCDVNSLGFKPGDQAWSSKYFELRSRYEKVSLDIFMENRS